MSIIGYTNLTAAPLPLSLTAQVQALFGKYSAAGGMWDFTNTATLFQDSAGTTPVTASGQSIGRVLDISGGSNTLIQSIAAQRPVFNPATGATPDGVDDFLLTAANLDLSACDKAVVGMGYTKLSHLIAMQIELSNSVLENSGTFCSLTGSYIAYHNLTAAGGSVLSNESQGAIYLSMVPNEYGAHIGRHSIPGDLSEMWWNGIKGVDGVADKGSGNFMDFPLYMFARGGVSHFSQTPSRRAIVLAPPVASAQVSDDDVELIRLWLMEGVV